MKRAQKKKENQTKLVSSHSVAIKQADESANIIAVKRNVPNVMSNINVDQPRISKQCTTIIPKTRESTETETRQTKWEQQRSIKLKKVL